MEELSKLLKIHLGNLDTERNWNISSSALSGRGVFANKELKPGDLIFKDIPLVTGPRLREDMVVCSSCLRGDVEVVACSEGCGLPLCKEPSDDACRSGHALHCHLLQTWHQSSFNTWITQFYYALTAISSLFLDHDRKKLLSMLQANRGPQHGLEISMMKEKIKAEELSKEDEDQMRLCCEVLDAVAFEVERTSLEEGKKWSLRGLFPLAGLMNHSCCPNTRKYFLSGPGDVMCVVPTRAIEAGEELTTHYCPLLWATPPRRHYLATTKHFMCSCDRCSDPTEFGTYLSAVKCVVCASGKMVPVSPLELSSGWACDSCSGRLDARQAVLAQSRLAQQVLRHQPTDPAPLPFLCQISVQLKLKNVWKCGQIMGALSYDELKENEISIRDILTLMENLRLGECRMRGILLYHLYITLREEERGNHKEDTEEMKTILKEATAILKDDRTSPKEFSKLIFSNN